MKDKQSSLLHILFYSWKNSVADEDRLSLSQKENQTEINHRKLLLLETENESILLIGL